MGEVRPVEIEEVRTGDVNLQIQAPSKRKDPDSYLIKRGLSGVLFGLSVVSSTPLVGLAFTSVVLLGCGARLCDVLRVRRSKYANLKREECLKALMSDRLEQTQNTFRSENINLNFAEKSIRVHYVHSTDSTKPKLLIIHGSFASSAPFLDVADRLAEIYEVHVLDLPGWGVSDDVDFESKSMDEISDLHAQLFEEYCQRLDLKNVVLMAHSVGAFFAIHFASRFSERVEKLVLLDAAGIFPTLGKTGAYWAALFKTSIHNRILRVMSPFLIPLMFQLSQDFLFLYSIVLLSTQMSGSSLLSRAISCNFKYSYWKYPCLHVFAKLKVPVGLIYGETDSLIPIHQGRVLSMLSGSLIPCFSVKGAWHAPHAIRFIPDFVDKFKDALEGARKPVEVMRTQDYVLQDLVPYSSCFNCRLSAQLIEELYERVLN